MSEQQANDFARLTDRMNASIHRVQALTEQVESERAAVADELENEVEQRERAARNGELGTAWQKVQQRIDMNQTTLDDVFSGRDESPEARQLMQQSQRASRQLREQFAQEAVDDPESDNPLTELSQLQRNLQEKLDALSERSRGYER